MCLYMHCSFCFNGRVLCGLQIFNSAEIDPFLLNLNDFSQISVVIGVKFLSIVLLQLYGVKLFILFFL